MKIINIFQKRTSTSILMFAMLALTFTACKKK